LEANAEKSDAVAEYQEVRKEEAALEDRCGDRHPAVGRRRQPKERTQGDGGSRKKLAAGSRRMTSRDDKITGRIFRKTVELEIENRVVGSLTGLREMND
jgi:hypothetical protein